MGNQRCFLLHVPHEDDVIPSFPTLELFAHAWAFQLPHTGTRLSHPPSRHLRGQLTYQPINIFIIPRVTHSNRSFP